MSGEWQTLNIAPHPGETIEAILARLDNLETEVAELRRLATPLRLGGLA